MDLENEKIGPAFKAPDSYFKELESRVLIRLNISLSESSIKNPTLFDQENLDAIAPKLTEDVNAVSTENIVIQAAPNALNTPASENLDIQKRARKTDPVTARSNGVSKEDEVGKVEIFPLTVTTNENPEWVNFSAISDEVSLEDSSIDQIVKITVENKIVDLTQNRESLPERKINASIEINELASIQTAETIKEETKPVVLDNPPTAFAPIAGRKKESATPGWLGFAASVAAVIAAYFIWNAIQPPKAEVNQTAELQKDEPTEITAPLDENVVLDSIPDGMQLLEPLILEPLPKNNEPNVYTIIDSKEMPEKTKRALQDLEDNGLAAFDMEDELFEELDLEPL